MAEKKVENIGLVNDANSTMENRVDIPVQRTDLTIFDDTFSTMKQKFIDEMRKMDEEMNKFSSDLVRLYGQPTTLHAAKSSAQQPITTQNTTSEPPVTTIKEPSEHHSIASAKKGSSSVKEMVEEQKGPAQPSNWDSLTKSPLVEGEGKNRTLKLQFDVSQFDPNEVTVRILDETLIISASHEEKSDNSSILRQYYREFRFPKGVDPATINSLLSKDGVLTVQAPLPQPAITDKENEKPTEKPQ